MSSDTHETDIAFIKSLTEVLTTSDLAEVEVERMYSEDNTLTVRLSRYSAAAPVAPAPAPVAVAAPVMADAPVASAAPAAAGTDDPAQHAGAVTSPMVGTAYLSPEPGSAPFVEVGSKVSEGQTLLIIEAMKTMNQIPAPHAGKVTRILIDDSTPVEFGAPLFIIE